MFYIPSLKFKNLKLQATFCTLLESFYIINTMFFLTGAGTGLVPMYLTEIAPVNIRGAMGVLHQFALTCGILVSQCMGLPQALGKGPFQNFRHLHTLFAVNIQ